MSLIIARPPGRIPGCNRVGPNTVPRRALHRSTQVCPKEGRPRILAHSGWPRVPRHTSGAIPLLALRQCRSSHKPCEGEPTREPCRPTCQPGSAFWLGPWVPCPNSSRGRGRLAIHFFALTHHHLATGGGAPI